MEQKQDNEMKAGMTKRFLDDTLEWIELPFPYETPQSLDSTVLISSRSGA